MNNLNFRISKKVLYIFLLYIISMFYFVQGLEILGFLAMTILLIIPIYLVIQKKKIFYDKLYIWIIVAFGYYLFILFKNISPKGIYNFILQLLILIDLVCVSSIDINYNSIISFARGFKKLSYILLIYNIMLVLFSGKLGIDYDTYRLAFKNIMYGSFFVGLYAKRQTLRSLIFNMFLYTVIMFLLRERTMALGAVLFLFIYWILDKVNSKKVLNIIFFVFCIVLALIPIIYVGLYESSLASHLNQIVGQYTHKNLFSGRQIIWGVALEKFANRKWFGYGLQNFTFSYTNVDMSVHNLYLYILLQGGIINLGLIGTVMYFIFQKLLKNKEKYSSKLAISALFTILFLADFGLILFANDIQYSIVLWTAVILGLLLNNKNNIKEIKETKVHG